MRRRQVCRDRKNCLPYFCLLRAQGSNRTRRYRQERGTELSHQTCPEDSQWCGSPYMGGTFSKLTTECCSGGGSLWGCQFRYTRPIGSSVPFQGLLTLARCAR